MLQNSGPDSGRGEAPPNLIAPINMSQNMNTNITPVNMTSASMNFNPLQIPPQINNVNSNFVHPINSPLNMSSINIYNSSRMNGMTSNYEDIMRQHYQSINTPANYLNGTSNIGINNGNSMSMYNQMIPSFNYYSNPMNYNYSTIHKVEPMNVKCENGVDNISAIREAEKNIINDSRKIITTENENLHKKHIIPENKLKEIVTKTFYENNGHDESLLHINYDKNPFVNDVHGVTMEYFNENNDKSKFTLLNTESSHGVAIKLVSEDKTDTQKIFQCQHCNLIFRNAKRFLIHYKWHSFGKFNNIPKLNNKEAKTHKKITKLDSAEVRDDTEVEEGKELEDVQCEFCNQKYRSKSKLNNHIRRVHSGRSKECPICRKPFQNMSYLKSHMTTHTEERKFMCDECPKTFKFVHSLMRHRPTHFKDKNFTCPTCDKSFGSRLLLKIHSKTHDRIVKGVEFRCTYCGKGFYHAYTLAIHERTHTGEKPFKCDICHSAYGTNSSLKRHLKVSHNNDSKPFECTLCQRAFTTDAMLDRHYMRCHPEPDGKHIRCQSCSEMFHSQTQCDAHTNKVHLKQDSEPQRKRRRKKQPQVIGHILS